jgi:hypothetical protein
VNVYESDFLSEPLFGTEMDISGIDFEKKGTV